MIPVHFSSGRACRATLVQLCHHDMHHLQYDNCCSAPTKNIGIKDYISVIPSQSLRVWEASAAFLPDRLAVYCKTAGTHLLVQSFSASANTPFFSKIKSISCSSYMYMHKWDTRGETCNRGIKGEELSENDGDRGNKRRYTNTMLGVQ